MKISFQPAVYIGSTNIQTPKNGPAKRQYNSAYLGYQSGFTGKSTQKNRLVPFLAAASATLLLLAGCGQQKTMPAGSGNNVQYVPSSSYSQNSPEEEYISTGIDDPAADAAEHEGPDSPEVVETPPDHKTPNVGDAIDEMDETECKLQIRYGKLEFIDAELGRINSDINAIEGRLKTKQEMLKRAEEKLETYNRKDPNDKPPGFEADYSAYLDFCSSVKELEDELAALNKSKENLKAQQGEILAEVSGLGGHPRLD